VGRTLLILAAVAAGYAVVYFMLKKKVARTLSAAAVLREVREEVNRILVELNQTTHRNVTLIEDRIAALSELLARADKKIALVRREEEKKELADKLYSELAARRRPVASALEAAKPGTEAGAKAGMEAGEAGESKPDKMGEAVRLAQAGLSPALISRRLGLTRGEVELILSLAEHQR
jgi:hypothetical protein